MKKILSVFASAIITSLLLVGCVGAEPTPEEGEENVGESEQELRKAPEDDLCDPPYYACPTGCCCPAGWTCG